MIGDSISVFASIGRLPIELWLLLCCLKQPPIIDSSTKFENRPFADKKLAQVQSACTKGWIAQRGENTSFFFDVLQRYVWTQIDKTSSAADQTHGCTSSLKDYDAIVDCFIDNSFSGENGE